LKLKTTAKFNSKQTLIATVRDQYWMYATFLTPLCSHYRLPLSTASEAIPWSGFLFVTLGSIHCTLAIPRSSQNHYLAISIYCTSALLPTL
jgi:hypothetical protein